MDKLGSTVFAGRFEGETTFGVGDRQTTFMSAGQEDGFVARYRPDGTLAWAVSNAGPRENAVVGLAVDGDGKTVVTGYFEADTTFFGTNDQPVTLASTVDVGAFMTRYTSDGALEWTTDAYTASSICEGHGIATDDAVPPPAPCPPFSPCSCSLQSATERCSSAPDAVTIRSHLPQISPGVDERCSSSKTVT